MPHGKTERFRHSLSLCLPQHTNRKHHILAVKYAGQREPVTTGSGRNSLDL